MWFASRWRNSVSRLQYQLLPIYLTGSDSLENPNLIHMGSSFIVLEKIIQGGYIILHLYQQYIGDPVS